MLARCLRDFLAGTGKQDWLRTEKVNVHVERSNRLLGDDYIVQTLDVSFPESQSYKWEFAEKIHKLNPYEVTYVFDLDDEMGKDLVENDWRVARRKNCYYKFTN